MVASSWTLPRNQPRTPYRPDPRSHDERIIEVVGCTALCLAYAEAVNDLAMIEPDQVLMRQLIARRDRIWRSTREAERLIITGRAGECDARLLREVADKLTASDLKIDLGSPDG